MQLSVFVMIKEVVTVYYVGRISNVTIGYVIILQTLCAKMDTHSHQYEHLLEVCLWLSKH